MNRLTAEKVQELANKKGVRRVAVENFLGTLGKEGELYATLNMRQDARDYKWNAATQAAISQGIKLYYGKSR